MAQPTTIPLWVKDDGPTSIQHRLRIAAMGASPDGTVVLRGGLAADLADALRAAGKTEQRREDEARATRVNLKLQKLTQAEERGWRWLFWVLGFVAGSGLNDILSAAWRWLR